MTTQPTENPPGANTPGGRVITYHYPWPDPEPIVNSLPPVEPFSFDTLPGEVRPWVEDVAERMQCPPDFPAVGIIIALATIIGRKVCIRPKREDDWTVVPNLWGMIIGSPAIMKTPALEQALNPLQRLENGAMSDYIQRRRENAAEELVQKERSELNRKQIQKALKEGNDDVARNAAEKIHAAGEALAITPRRYIVNDPTVEKLGELLQENPNGLLLHRDELVGFLKGLEKEGREDYRAFYLEAWNGANPFTFDRIGRGTVRIDAVTLSILGAIQPDALGDYLKHAMADGTLGTGDGLLQRFQVTLWPDCGSEWKNVDRSPNCEARDRVNAVFDRLVVLDGATAGAEAAVLPFVRFTPGAQEAFDDWRKKLEGDLRSTGEHPAVLGHLAKYRSLVPSLALIAHLADGQKGGVNGDALAKALRWAKILESHARRLYTSAMRRHQSSAGMLAARLAKGQLGELFSTRDLYRKGWVGLSEKDDAEKALEMLEANGYVRRRYIQRDAGQLGRPASEVYQVSPKIFQSGQDGGDKSAKTDAGTNLSFLSPASA